MIEFILGNYLVENGKISEDQLKNVLEKISVKDFKKGNCYHIFTGALQEENLVSSEELDWLMNDFRQSSGYSEKELEDFLSDDVEKVVPLLLPQEGRRYKYLAIAAIKTIVKYVEKCVYIGRACMVDTFPTNLYVCQAVVRKDGIVDFFSERDGALLKIARSYARENFEKIDEDSLDSAGEFLNCINGVYASSQSREGDFYELKPPVINNCEEKVDMSSLCRIPIFIGNCGLYLTVAQVLQEV